MLAGPLSVFITGRGESLKQSRAPRAALVRIYILTFADVLLCYELEYENERSVHPEATRGKRFVRTEDYDTPEERKPTCFHHSPHLSRDQRFEDRRSETDEKKETRSESCVFSPSLSCHDPDPCCQLVDTGDTLEKTCMPQGRGFGEVQIEQNPWIVRDDFDVIEEEDQEEWM